MGFSELLKVQIDFDQSHLFFPAIIHWLLLIMAIVIVVFQGISYWREIRAGKRTLLLTGGHFDKLRFIGTLVLTIIYFFSMEHVGDRFPNTGLGFLLTSIPYMFLLSVLYLHERNGKILLMAGVNALLAPVFVWYVLAQLFNITLP